MNKQTRKNKKYFVHMRWSYCIDNMLLDAFQACESSLKRRLEGAASKRNAGNGPLRGQLTTPFNPGDRRRRLYAPHGYHDYASMPF